MPKPNESVPDNSWSREPPRSRPHFRTPARSPQYADIITVFGQAGHRHITLAPVSAMLAPSLNRKAFFSSLTLPLTQLTISPLTNSIRCTKG